jgi:hypothetical protein
MVPFVTGETGWPAPRRGGLFALNALNAHYSRNPVTIWTGLKR